MNMISEQVAPPDDGARLLLCDDDPAYLEAINAELTDRGFSVTAFSDGATMMDWLSRGSEADVIVLVGSNTAWCHPILFRRMIDARAKRGTKLVVVDPRRTQTGEEADLFLGLEDDDGHADEDDAPPHPWGEDAFSGRTRRPLHESGVRRVDPERQRRRAIGDEVDPQDLCRQQRQHDGLIGDETDLFRQ